MVLSERQRKIFDAFLEDPEEAQSVADFASFGLERTTLFRDLRKLVGAGLLRLEGKSYRLNRGSDAYLRWDLSRAPHTRPAVSYNSAVLGDYKPNSTFLLTDTQLRELEQAGVVPAVSEGQERAYERVLRSLLIDLTHASSNLENVHISWLDTKTLIEFGEQPKGFSEVQLRIVLNHKAAITFLSEHRHNPSLAKRDLLDLHSLLVTGLFGNKSAVGTLRSVIVRFDDSRYLPPDNPHQLREAFEEFCEKAQAITNPYEQAFFTMAFIPYLQPFQDGNKRTSRLAMNIPLIKHALAPFSFSDIAHGDYMFGLLAFYERARHGFLADAFVAAYKKSADRYVELVSHVNSGGLLSTIST